MMAPMTARTLTIGRGTYPVVLPNIRDPRLHVAAVVLTVHVLGQVGLGFWVSVPQIIAAIGTCWLIEVAITFWQTRQFVWPASAMLTGSAVALIMRVVGTPPDDRWSTYAWYVFAGVAALSLLSKYVIRHRGSHIFNPANIGLVVTFAVLGSTRVEPLDFWWAPLNPWMLTAYAVIIAGGLLITRRLHLLLLAATFWVALTLGVGTLAASGHCMVTRWSFAPVCGFDFWRVIVTSPEVLVFLFFMITDPKTVPPGRVGRIVFALLLAVVATVLMAPQTNEFGTKVALLGSLVIVCAVRPLLERLVPGAHTADDDPGRFATRLVTGGSTGAAAVVLPRALARVGLLAVAVGLAGVGIVAAGAPARGVVDPAVADVLGRLPSEIDPATLPSISVAQDVVDWNHEITGEGAQQIVLALAENLQVERQALQRGEVETLEAVDHGDRLDEMRRRIEEASDGGTKVVEQYQIDDVKITLVVPFGRQAGLSLGLEARGTVTTETYDAGGGLQSRSSAPFATSFVMGRPTGGRWLTVAVLPLEAPT